MFSQSKPYLIFRPDPFARYWLQRTLANRRNELSRRIRIADLNNRCRRSSKFGAEFEADFSDDGQRSERTAVQFLQIVSGDVLHDTSSGLRDSTRNFDDLHSDDPVSNRARRPEWSLRVRGRNTPNRRLRTIPWIERQKLIVLQQRMLELAERNAGFDVYCQVCRIVFGDSSKT